MYKKLLYGLLAAISLYAGNALHGKSSLISSREEVLVSSREEELDAYSKSLRACVVFGPNLDSLSDLRIEYLVSMSENESKYTDKSAACACLNAYEDYLRKAIEALNVAGLPENNLFPNDPILSRRAIENNEWNKDRLRKRLELLRKK